MNIARRTHLLALLLIFAILPGFGCQITARRAGDDTDCATQSITHDGLERTYRLHTPPGYDATEPTPLVIALHGGGGSGEKMAELTGGLNALADQEGFIVVYPDGVEKHWNDGRGIPKWRAHRENIDDVGFLSALIEHIGRDFNIDAKRIYVTGISNGGMMAFRLACELPEKIAAIAPVVASISENLVAQCAPSQPVPVLIISGTEDPLVPWEGGEVRVGDQVLGKVLSASDTAQFWVIQNHCATSPIIAWEPDKDPKDGTQVRREAYEQCDNENEVVLYIIEGGGHTWPGGQQYLPESVVGRVSQDIDANEIIWRFFEGHTKE